MNYLFFLSKKLYLLPGKFHHFLIEEGYRYLLNLLNFHILHWLVGQNSNLRLFDQEGNLYACEGEGRRLVQYSKGKETVIITDNFEGKKYNEPNDLAIYPDGRNIWFSDPNYGGRKPFLEHESVYLAQKTSNDSWNISRATFDTTRPYGVLLSKDTKLFT